MKNKENLLNERVRNLKKMEPNLSLLNAFHLMII